MSEDVLSRAEEACEKLESKDESVDRHYWQAVAGDLLPQLLAEARGLEDRVTQLKMDCDQQHKHAMEWQEEAAKWWQIAIEKGAIIKFLQEAHSTKIQLRAAKAQMKHWDQLPDVFKDSWRKSAARELETASSEHFSGSTKMIELTPERRTALEYAIFAIEQLGSDPEVLRAMLAGGKRDA